MAWKQLHLERRICESTRKHGSASMLLDYRRFLTGLLGMGRHGRGTTKPRMQDRLAGTLLARQLCNRPSNGYTAEGRFALDHRWEV